MYDDFRRFCGYQLASEDVDPLYPVLSHCLWQLNLSTEERFQLVFLYLAYYNLASALQVWLSSGRVSPLHIDSAKLPTGTERRNLRGGVKMNEHLASLAQYRPLSTWLTEDLSFRPKMAKENWKLVSRRLESVEGNGRWAAYKGCEVLQKVLNLPLRASDAGHAFSTGPRKGLALFYPGVPGNSPLAIEALDIQTEGLRNRLAADEVSMGVEQLETMLCDWHSVMSAHYYVGHDIDLNLQDLAKAPRAVAVMLLEARQASFDEMWLGEKRGWPGVRTELNSLYIQRGKLRWWS